MEKTKQNDITLSLHYRMDLDILKGISIIAVMLYHFGACNSGYLGVDAFLVINGFLIVPKICKSISDGSFKYFISLKNRLMRLYPVLVIACLFCIIMGSISMLPDDYENLSQQVIATIFGSNNILQAITTKNYWNVVNEFKPLMHTWYLGILIHFYVIFPIILILVKNVSRKIINTKMETIINITVLILCVGSLLCFLLPYASDANKFYYLPFRMFELLVGGLLGNFANHNGYKQKQDLIRIGFWIAFVLVLFYGIYNVNFNLLGGQVVPIGAKEVSNNDLLLPNWSLVLITVALTSVIIYCGDIINRFKISLVFAGIGKRSYSLYIWHQIIVAFCRYYITYKINLPILLVIIIITFFISELSYRVIEKRSVWRKRQGDIFVVSISALALILSSYIYLHAGVIRDVPELEIYKNNIHKNMHSEYCDRIYQYDKDFEVDGKIHVLIVGNSFARDWGNILLESDMTDHISISYSYTFDDSILERINSCDYIFAFMDKNDIPQYVWDNTDEAKVWGIGTKNFGESNGVIYARRNSEEYFNLTVELSTSYKELNEIWKSGWGDNYIDLIEPVLTQDGEVRVFSDDNLFMSQDCHHLTRGGAQYYANNLDFTSIFGE